MLPGHSERLKLPIGVPIHVVFFWILFLCGDKIKHHSVGYLYTYEISPPFYPIQSPFKHDIPVETFKWQLSWAPKRSKVLCSGVAAFKELKAAEKDYERLHGQAEEVDAVQWGMGHPGAIFSWGT